jgi:hypothetical protein
MLRFDEALVNIRRLAVTLDKNTSSERLPFSKERSTRIDVTTFHQRFFSDFRPTAFG